ncbi:hypothetical protein MTR67_038560 [Solanum verrucosum]|uniref:DUF4216 domain-containing protein n=1 Tax=Solanum verrucosum TaxID=315347 RepID=A0AAF0UFF1_SOLVR|nr:hypothetical protein MTR67_038560 [Solanum verrucosum]
MRVAYRAREMSNFDSYYFESDVPCLRNRPNRHGDGGIIDHLAPPFSIFNYPGKGGPKYTPKRKLTEMELNSATTHVLLNCPEVQPYHSYFVGTYGNDVVYSRFSDWFKEHVHNPVNVVDVVNVQFLRDISWGPDHRVRIMSKYFINGYKFHTEEWSKGKKTNNSGVWVKGEGDINYYGVLQEIIELEYIVGWPKKKLVIFRCKWYDPDSSGTKVHPQYKIIEINHTRQYRFYDLFIIAQNVKQVYYVPYPLCKNKSSWRVVIKTKPVGEWRLRMHWM